jgi:glucose/arabinose dehydrogenase
MPRGAAVTAVAAAALAAACSRGDSTPAPAAPPTASPTGASTVAQPPTHEFPRARRISVPDGFRAEVYATGLEHPTAMAWGPDGLLYVTQDIGTLVVVRPLDRRPRVFVRGLETPLGLVWKGRTLFISEQGRMEAVRLSERRAVARRTVVSGLPYGLHQQDNIVVGTDGRLYFGSGSTCDACVERDPRSAAVLSVHPSGRDLRIVARGLRNPFGLAFQPETGRLYASVNSRDDLPDPESAEPAEMLVLIEEGAHYGFPDCWPSARRKRMMGSCGRVTPPVAYLEAHSSADGLAFYTGSTFPARYRDGVFVALWGQYASTEHGRRVDFVALRQDGTAPANGVEPFADGFAHPLALAVDPHGALLVADWGTGTIYRIQARGEP